MRIHVAKNYEEMSQKAANIIAAQIIRKSNSTLGLAIVYFDPTDLATYYLVRIP